MQTMQEVQIGIEFGCKHIISSISIGEPPGWDWRGSKMAVLKYLICGNRHQIWQCTGFFTKFGEEFGDLLNSSKNLVTNCSPNTLEFLPLLIVGICWVINKISIWNYDWRLWEFSGTWKFLGSWTFSIPWNFPGPGNFQNPWKILGF